MAIKRGSQRRQIDVPYIEHKAECGICGNGLILYKVAYDEHVCCRCEARSRCFGEDIIKNIWHTRERYDAMRRMGQW